VTIIPRGRALGVTMFLPERDKYSQTVSELRARIVGLFGGRVAEELVFGKHKITTGAGDDIRRATDIARAMVTQFGFSEKLGPLRYEGNEEEVFLGHSVTQRKNISDATAQIIDEEVRRFVDEAEKEARRILTERLDDLHKVAKALLEHETLSAADVKKVLKGETIERPTIDEPPRAGPTTPAGKRPHRGSVPTSRPGGIAPEPST
jgi:cell division protease FtsH